MPWLAAAAPRKITKWVGNSGGGCSPRSKPCALGIFRALLLAAEHGKPVPHFRTAKYYENLVCGQEAPKRQRHFKFHGQGGHAQPARRPRKALRLPALPAASGGSSTSSGSSPSTSSDSSSSTSSASGPGSATPPRSPCAPSHSGVVDVVSAASRSDEDSSFAAGSSSTSSSSSSGSGAAPVASQGSKGLRAPSALEHRRPAPAPAAPGTYYWKGFKIAEVRRRGVAVGYEARCYCRGHATGTTGCTRFMSWSVGGGPEMTERKLKWWRLQGRLCQTRVDHQQLPPRNPDSLPTLEELELARGPE